MVGHVGGVVMDLPVARDRNVQGIQLSIDHHDAVFSAVAIGSPSVEVLDHEEVLSWKLVDCAGEIVDRLHVEEVLSTVESGRAQEKREDEASAAQSCSCVGG